MADAAPLPPWLVRPGPKRILSIDGGGVRGALAVGVLAKLEAMLRDKLGRPGLVLSDYFDLIGGTSTGAIIAAGLALGRDTETLRRLYHDLGPRVFVRNPLRLPGVQARFDPRRLERVLVEELGPATLADADWKSGFCAVAKRVDTGSTWVMTNCPRAKYWDGDPDEGARQPNPALRRTVANKDYILAKVVQASAAAPFFFDLVPIEVERGKPGVFFDGAITAHGNPALQLAMTALAPAYGFGWAAGADRLMIVSVGTGAARPMKPGWVKPPLLAAWKAIHALMSVAYDTSELAVSTLQWLGASPRPWRINSEVGGFEDARPAGMAPLWTFIRYDAPLEAGWLQRNLGRTVEPRTLAALQKLDDDAQIPLLHQIGLEAGERQVRAADYPQGFDPAS